MGPRMLLVNTICRMLSSAAHWYVLCFMEAQNYISTHLICSTAKEKDGTKNIIERWIDGKSERGVRVWVCVWLWMQHYVFGIYKNYRFALELFVVVVVDTYTLVGNMHIYTDCYKSSISCQLSVCSRSPYAGTSPLYAFERCELCLI